MESIGTRIKREREARGIDRTQLSKLTGVGYTTLSELERGGMKTTTKLRVIADALNVSLEWLETGDGEKERPEVASQPAGLERSKIAAAVRISHYVRDAALEPMSDERYVEVLAAALQLVAEQPESEANLPQAAREVAARVRSQG